jgi:hypothetical protein
MAAIAYKFQLNYCFVFREQKIHPSAGACIARRELFRPDVSDPRP